MVETTIILQESLTNNHVEVPLHVIASFLIPLDSPLACLSSNCLPAINSYVGCVPLCDPNSTLPNRLLITACRWDTSNFLK